jgi:hypothetical protein
MIEFSFIRAANSRRPNLINHFENPDTLTILDLLNQADPLVIYCRNNPEKSKQMCL